MKKQRKSSSSDSDFYETQSASKVNECKPDEQIASTSLTASTPKDDEKDSADDVNAPPNPMECVTTSDEPPQDDEMTEQQQQFDSSSTENLANLPRVCQTFSPYKMHDSDKKISKPTFQVNVGQPNPDKATHLNVGKTSFSNSSSVSTGSSPDTHSLPINTSTEHEQSLERDFERKLLQKIEYHLMDIFQHLDETETAESESGLSRYTQNNCSSSGGGGGGSGVGGGGSSAGEGGTGTGAGDTSN